MNQQTARNLTLFDLLARSWRRPSAIASLCFSADGSALAVAAVDGAVAIAAVADHEPPEKRLRVSGDLGQATIRPRDTAPTPLIAAVPAGDGLAIAAFGASDFLAGGGDGDIVRLTADGAVESTLFAVDGPVAAIAHSSRTGLVAATSGSGVCLARGTGGSDRSRFDPGSTVAALAFSADGLALAVASGNRVSVWSVDGDPSLAGDFEFPARPLSLAWSGDGAWIAAPLEAGGLGLASLAERRSATVAGFPAPVRTACWNAPADALLASGAFRIAGWSMTAPPLDGDKSGALETGRAGLVLVEAVASHPERKLVAAGYANGQITVAQIGARDELIVRPAGGALTALAWSGDGRHLAAGDAEGVAAIVTFPDQIFK